MSIPVGINSVNLSGKIKTEPQILFSSHGKDYCGFKLEVQRLSGNYDVIDVLFPESMMPEFELDVGKGLRVSGQLRTYNNKSGIGNRLVISVYAKEMHEAEGESENVVQLLGVICKTPVLRKTPLGREICDIMLAVNRSYGRADYLPVITWGKTAKAMSVLDVGSAVRVEGRIQSRNYTKLTEDGPEQRTAYEVSAINAEGYEIGDGFGEVN